MKPQDSTMSFVSFAVVPLWNALSIPETKLPIDGTTSVSYVLPPVICSLFAAVLAVTPRTRTLRIALWPIIALLALRATLSVDMSLGRPERKFLNVDLALFMLSITVRTFAWASEKGPLVRHLHPANSFPSTILDALDLFLGLRGVGWAWSHGSHIPRETRPVDRTAFLLHTAASAIIHIFITATLQRIILTLAPLGVGPSPHGSTIFDDALPFLTRYVRASVISTAAALSIYSVLQMGYDLAILPAVLVLGHRPAQWPPVFDAPWRATSLTDFWGRRWHQLFRQMFLVMGGYPLARILGRPGAVLGAFLASAVLHLVALNALGNHPIDARWMWVGFGMMGPGVLIERAFSRVTGRRVGGMFGWVWTMSWLLMWGNAIIEGFARAGLFGSANIADALPAWMSSERLAMGLDAWLHAL